MTLSLCMIVKNEEEVLARALKNAAVYADEIVIVDTGSTDGTKAIARSFTDKVYDFAWCDDFGAARNFAVSKAKCDYWMWLDADDVVPEKSARGIANLMRRLDPSVDVVMLPYSMGSDASAFTFSRERIIKNSPEFLWKGRVHEAVPLRGNVISKSFTVFHEKPSSRTGSTRNLDIYKKMIADGDSFSPRESYYYARELYFNGEYKDAAREFERFLTLDGAFKPNLVDACLMLSRCFSRLGDKKSSLEALLFSLTFGVPTGEVACEIGLKFFGENDYATAAYWFERACSVKPDINSGAFIDYDCYNFLPYVWLTVCYDRLGKMRAAYYWHCRAKKIKPDHPSVAANQAYFDGIMGESAISAKTLNKRR